MNALAQRLARLIETQGPISVAQFMAVVLHDPLQGYYATSDSVGAAGDFITAPEISQIFGELLGLWCVQAWRDQGYPAPARLIELGPGRGTLMADMLRAAHLAPDFLSAIEVVLVETSPRLREAQASKLKTCLSPIGREGWSEGVVPQVKWADHFDDTLTDRPLFLLANEFFDTLPIRQFVFTERGWCERMLGFDDQRHLAFSLSPMPLPLKIPPERGIPHPGDIYECCPSGEAIVGRIGEAIAKQGGAALIVDYGYGSHVGFGETLQAVASHKFAVVLNNPGEADLSAHVDFAALARAAERAGADAYGPVSQGTVLRRLGLEQRSESLIRANPDHQRDIVSAVERLTAPEEMGTLFKALAIMPQSAPTPAGF